MPHLAPAVRRHSPPLLVAMVAGVLAATLATPTAQARDLASAGTAHFAATHGSGGRHGTQLTVSSRQAKAERALAAAKAALSPTTPVGQRPDATLALRRLFLLKAALAPRQRAQADRLSARPGATSVDCSSAYECVHWNPSQVAPGWPATVRGVVDHVATTYRAAGYRAPQPDGHHGGNSKTDIYIEPLSPGLYGYCTSDQKHLSAPGHYNVWAYCVLDNDYAGFPAHTPLENLQVTTAHEFFHATQFAYDAAEDGWMLEATATWAEDQLYSSVNDNVQYLANSPITRPKTSMDLFKPGQNFIYYGDWIFFRYLTERYTARNGPLPRLMLQFWKAADSSRGPRHDRYSVQAIDKVLHGRHTSLVQQFAAFSDANLRTHTEYSEGAVNNYPAKPVAGHKRLTHKGASKTFHAKLDHLTSSSFAFLSKSLTSSQIRLNLQVALGTHASRAVVSTYKQNGHVRTKTIKVNAHGNGSKKIRFSSSSVSYVVVTLVNASTRYRHCFTQRPYSCSGKPLDQNVAESVKATVVKKHHGHRNQRSRGHRSARVG